MAGHEIIPFRKVNHCKLIWLIQNVYQCRTLRRTSINGPDFVTKSVRPFPWALKLGQSTKKEGISLYIRGVNLPEEILVSFHVYVRKQTSGKPLLDKKYRVIFDSQKVWESPLLSTNEDFDTEPLKEKPCDFWDIHVELMWNEIVEPEIGVKKDSYDALSKLLCFKELGSDLKQFYKNSRFSDFSIRCESKEIPVHKAILEARCPYFVQKINSYSGGDWNETSTSLAPTKDKDVMNAFLMYLYTGDIESLMEDGTLPVGIHKCAQRLRKYDLEWLTSPVQLCGFTRVLQKSLGYAWNSGDLYEIFKNDELQAVSCNQIADDAIRFSLQVKLYKSKHSVDYISVFLEVEEMAKENVYVVFEVTATNKEKKRISKKCSGDMTLKSSIGFPEFISIDNFVDTQSIILCSSIHYYDDTLSTQIDKMSVNCIVKPQMKSDGISPKLLLGEGCHGWILLSYDIGKLLMSENCSDCVIVVADDRFPAHRVILAARSSYFSVVFNRKEDECIGSSKGMEVLVEKDIKISPEMMTTILEEIYTGSSCIQDSQLAQDICKYAKFFGLKTLEMKCINYSEST